MIAARRQDAGAVAVEFALVASVLILLLTGTLSAAVLIWAEAALQSVSAQTARCSALGSSLCPSPAQYAVTLAQERLFAGVISTSNVAVTTASACNSATGKYSVVTITSSYWGGGWLSPVFKGIQLNATACYPSHS